MNIPITTISPKNSNPQKPHQEKSFQPGDTAIKHGAQNVRHRDYPVRLKSVNWTAFSVDNRGKSLSLIDGVVQLWGCHLISKKTVVLACFVLLLQIGFASQLLATDSTPRALAQDLGPDTGKSPVICLIVKDTVYTPLEDRLQRWKSDKENLGATVVVKIVSNESPSAIRSYLKNVTNLVGCLMVGDIPYVEYEWNFTDIDGTQKHDRFPTDLYYMNLHTNWIDKNGNGAYDTISGSLTPDIWVGRLKASNLSGGETELLKNYFDKNHNYIMGVLTRPRRALVYVDEVTDYYVDELAPATVNAMREIYPDIVSVYDRRYTNATDYMARLDEPFSLVRIIVHSGGIGHHFLYNGNWDGKIYPLDIKSLDPKAFFYVITSCNDFDYRRRDYMGAWYLFGSYGLFAMGDSSVSDILNVLPERFYPSLKTSSFGAAYLAWAAQCVARKMNPTNIINYVLLGDPSLGITTTIPVPEYSGIGVQTVMLAILGITICLKKRIMKN